MVNPKITLPLCNNLHRKPIVFNNNKNFDMKQLFFALFLGAFAFPLVAQEPEPYQFKEFKHVACTPVKNQEQTGTCWCFSALSFLESECLRVGKGESNLSEMFVVRNTYRQKCENYVRRQGTAQLGEGGLAHDLINAVRQYGIVPEEAYPGRSDLGKPYNHSKLEEKLKKLCGDLVVLGKKGKLPNDWIGSVDSLLDAEFGKVPPSFNANNKKFTPTQYRDFLGLNMDDYVTITSFTHHPFYQSFVLEVPDNFSNGLFYNLPLDEMMRCLNFSLQQGYSVEWDADVSNDGFAAKYGMALVPAKEWKDKNDAQRAGTFKNVEEEKAVAQDYRQQMFDRQETMDDHLMHIVGILDEPHNGVFYQVKNSWGPISDQKGFVNTSEQYMRLNTISFTVNKYALPVDVRRRLGLEPGEANIRRQGMPGRPNGPMELRQIEPGRPGQDRQGSSPEKRQVTPAPKGKKAVETKDE